MEETDRPDRLRNVGQNSHFIFYSSLPIKDSFLKKKNRGRHRDVLKIQYRIPSDHREVMKKRYFLTGCILSVHEISVSPKILPKMHVHGIEGDKREAKSIDSLT